MIKKYKNINFKQKNFKFCWNSNANTVPNEVQEGV